MKVVLPLKEVSIYWEVDIGLGVIVSRMPFFSGKIL